MDALTAFNSIRDIPYKIPVKTNQSDNCCSGKHAKLLKRLTKIGYKARYRVCVFLWNRLNIPSKLKKIPHDKDCTHTYLEIYLGGRWRILDATWDSGLKKIFYVNQWDGKSNTKIAFKPIKTFSPAKSLRIVKNQKGSVIQKDLERNGEFYKALNKWLDEKRNSSS